MQEFFNRIVKIGIAILIICIVLYGIAYAQRVCCSIISDACIPTFTRNLPSQDLINQRLSNFCSDSVSTGGNTCCETDGCNSYNQISYITLSFIQDVYPLNKKVSFSDDRNGIQTKFEPYCISTFLNAVPIYILTKSITC